MSSPPNSEQGQSSTLEPNVTETTAYTGEPHIPDLDESQVKKLLEDAEELKQEGNDYFRASQWNQALVTYQSALGRLPKRPVSHTQKDKMRAVDDSEQIEEEQSPGGSSSQSVDVEDISSTPAVAYPLQSECAKARSVLNANIAACHVKLSEHKEVVAACTEALLDDPNYVKALQRRAASNEQLDTWASLTSAQEDYTKLLGLLSSGSAQYIETRRALNALKPRAEAAQKRETSEMLDKLKGIGNSILGNFGLSTNNFQFTPNGQGGYSMQFVQ